MQDIVAAAKNEGEISFVAGSETFGGKKAFAELEKAFNKRFGLNAKINFSSGPSMPAMAGRVVTELKAGRKASTDVFIGFPTHIATLHKEKGLTQVDWSGTFPWIKKEMEILPGESVLVYISVQGIIYNSNLVPKDKAPKSYEDLVDPKLSPTWAGKLAIPPYTSWIVDLALITGEAKAKDLAHKLVGISAGRLRYSEAEERVASGEFAVMANLGSAIEAMWQWQAKGAPLVGVAGSTPALTSYVQLAVPKNAAHPNLAKLFNAFMMTKEAQTIIEKHDLRTSHLIEGTRAQKYLAESGVKLQSAKEMMDLYIDGKGLALNKEISRILKK